MDRFTWKAPDGTYQIDDCMAIHRTLCYDENFKNPFDIYEGKAIDKLGQYEDMTEREQIKAILKRMRREIYYEDSNHIEFETDGYETWSVEFDDNGLVIAMY